MDINTFWTVIIGLIMLVGAYLLHYLKKYIDKYLSKCVDKSLNYGELAINPNRYDFEINITNVGSAKVRLESIHMVNARLEEKEGYMLLLRDGDKGGGPPQIIPVVKKEIGKSDIILNEFSVMKGVFDLDVNESGDLFIPPFKYQGEHLLFSYDIVIKYHDFNNFSKLEKIEIPGFFQQVFDVQSAENINHLNTQNNRTFFLKDLSGCLIMPDYYEKDSRRTPFLTELILKENDVFFFEKNDYYLEQLLKFCANSEKKIKVYVYEDDKFTKNHYPFIITDKYTYAHYLGHNHFNDSAYIALEIEKKGIVGSTQTEHFIKQAQTRSKLYDI